MGRLMFKRFYTGAEQFTIPSFVRPLLAHEFYSMSHCLACFDDVVTVWIFKHQMAATTAHKNIWIQINPGSSKSKQGN